MVHASLTMVGTEATELKSRSEAPRADVVREDNALRRSKLGRKDQFSYILLHQAVVPPTPDPSSDGGNPH